MNPRLLLLAVMLASPALASTPALHLLHAEDATPSTMPLLSPEAAALPYSLHVAAPTLNFTRADLPSHLPLPAIPDEGGGAGASVSSDVIPVLAILLALFVGFGTGHLVVHDREGFILFLIVDVVIVAVSSVLSGVFFGAGFWWLGWTGIGGVAFLISHLIQVLDVYGKAFGTKLLDRARATTMEIALPKSGPDLMLPGGAQRVLSWSF
jgi:hypothetical protein